MDSAGWLPLDRSHTWHPYTQVAAAPAPVPILCAEGAYLHTADGRAILDAISSWWVTLHGHRHPRLIGALVEEAKRFDHVIFAGFAHEPAARLAAELVRRAPAGLSRVFFSDDGSTAVETALKMALQYFSNRGEPERRLFIGLEGGYHGDTFGAMAAGGSSPFNTPFRPLFFPALRAPSPRNPAECAAGIERLLDEDGRRAAAVILEPILQGAGGMVVFPPPVLRAARAACDRAGALLIADEVLTGFGRTGKLFACEHGPIAPDILCLSKALTGGVMPLGATLATEEIFAAFLSPDRARAFLHGHSYTANPLGCAVALENLAVLDDERGIERARKLETLYRDRLDRLRGRRAVRETRAIGMVAALEIKPETGGGYLDTLGPRLQAEFLARDILLRPLGNVVYVLPPLCITDAEVHRVFDAIEEVLDAL